MFSRARLTVVAACVTLVPFALVVIVAARDATGAPRQQDTTAAPAGGSAESENARQAAFLFSMHGEKGSDTVVGMRADGTLLGTVSTGVPEGQALHELRGLLPVGDGTYLVVNSWVGGTRVLRFGGIDAQGRSPFLATVIEAGKHNPAMVHTYGVAIAPDGSIYCSNQDTNTVTRYAGLTSGAVGTPLQVPPELTKHGATVAPGVFVPSEKDVKDGLKAVRGITFGPDGLLYVVDRDRSRVDGYNTATGKREKTLAHEKDGLRHPIQVAFAADGTAAYISDNKANCIWRVDLSTMGVSAFVAPGAGGLNEPSALLIDNDRLIVGSRVGKQLLSFSLKDGSPLPPLASNLADGPEFVIRAPRAAAGR